MELMKNLMNVLLTGKIKNTLLIYKAALLNVLMI